MVREENFVNASRLTVHCDSLHTAKQVMELAECDELHEYFIISYRDH